VQLLDLLQISDSSFPTGGYAHSVGLEGLYAMGDVELEPHLRFLLRNGLERVELPVVRLAAGGSDAVELDQLMDVLLPARELREASRSMGRSLFRAVNAFAPLGARAEHHAVVYGLIVREWRLDLDEALRAYAFSALRQQLAAAQRMGRIGQTAVQRLLHALKADVERAAVASHDLELEDIGGFAPLLDFAAMAHAHQPARLFLS
jgi:urease accessory protein